MPLFILGQQPSRSATIPRPQRLSLVRALLVGPLHLQNDTLGAANRRSHVGDFSVFEGRPQTLTAKRELTRTVSGAKQQAMPSRQDVVGAIAVLRETARRTMRVNPVPTITS